jgi:DNA modification methylase
MLQEYGGNAKEKRYHPTQKPASLFEDIIIMYSKPNHIIIDPYSGSGTTGIACQRQTRQWIMIEREEKYCEIAAKRISKETAQLDLFEDTKPIIKPKQQELFA